MNSSPALPLRCICFQIWLLAGSLHHPRNLLTARRQHSADIHQMAAGSSEICGCFGLPASCDRQLDSRPSSADGAEARRSQVERLERQIFRNQDARLPLYLMEHVTPNASYRWRDCRRTQFDDQPQDVGEGSSRNGNLRHLERDIAAVADDLRADRDQRFLEAGQRRSLIGSGVASVRKKLPRLEASA